MISHTCFRPLAGISCFQHQGGGIPFPAGFRPLAGISCFRIAMARFTPGPNGFRPLAGISCFNSGGLGRGIRDVFVP